MVILSKMFILSTVEIFFKKLFGMHFKKNLFNIMRRADFKLHHQYTSVHLVGRYAAFCGSQSFISGKYYWELDLKDSSDWAVGVCTNSWLMNRNNFVETEGAFLLFCMKEGSHYSLLTTNPVIHHYIEKPLDKIGVFLDCEAGYLSFLNIAKSSLIYRYPHKTFKYRVWPFFSYGQIIP